MCGRRKPNRAGGGSVAFRCSSQTIRKSSRSITATALLAASPPAPVVAPSLSPRTLFAPLMTTGVEGVTIAPNDGGLIYPVTPY